MNRLLRHAGVLVTAACALMTINGSGGPATARVSYAREPGPVPVGRPGAPGVGDAYFPNAGNDGYDVADYQVDLRYFPEDQRIDATATISATATQDLSEFDLDFRGPEISDVLVDGLPALYRRDGQELVVTPARALRRNASFTTVVRYSGRPRPVRSTGLGTYGWVPTKDGAVVAGEPDGASTWLPVNDHPRDKATYIFRVTVPRNLQVVANGVPHPPVTRGANTTYVWAERHPMASYLATVAIGRFSFRRDTVGDVTVVTAVDPRFEKAAERVHATTMEVLQWQAKVFGTYPFPTAGAIVDDVRLGYALETQERPLYSGFTPDERFIVHELAHQWFGDSVSLWRWQDVWLNEGFATYAEWLWQEHTGRDTAAKIFDRYHRQPARAQIFSPPPGDPGVRRLFSPSVYVRGAMCLQALRARIGDQRFFRILREWPATHRYGNATVAEFTVFAERIAGTRLDRFFRDWLYRKGKPDR